MQENEFEKRMREEMGEFRLRPSDAIWERVEEQLKKKKRRRVVFFIFLLAGLSLLSYSGYFLTKTNSNQNLVQQDNNLLPDSKKSETISKQQVLPAKENETAKAQTAIKDHTVKEQQLFQRREKDQEEKTANILNNDKKILPGSDIAVKYQEKIKKINPGNYRITQSTGEKDVDFTKTDNQKKKTEEQLKNNSSDRPTDKTDISQHDIAKNNLQNDNKIDDRKIITQKVNEPAKPDSSIAEASKTDEAIAATKKKRTASKTKWGIDLSAGRSSNRSNAFSIFDMNKSMAMDYYSPGSATGGGNTASSSISPSDIKAGLAFRAGLVAEMKLSKRSSIISGLQYLYRSSKIQVGYYSDTTVVVNNSFSLDSRVNAIYRGSLRKEYTNHYHFIQIPLQYQLQLNKGLKFPILWSIGVSAGYLFATNGLVYDTAAGGIYYRDNAAFNKLQFNLNTGLSLRFGSKNKIQWSLGPELSLGMNKLMKDEYTKKKYPLYGGFTGRLFFQKKK